MTGEIILNNTFFSFWYILGENFVLILNISIFLTIFFALYYLIIKR